MKILRRHSSVLALIFVLMLTACGNGDDASIGDMDDVNDPTDNGSISFCETNDTVDPFTNTEIEAMRQAMLTFRNSLSEALLAAASNCLEDERFYLWHNTPANGTRDGITYGDLTDDQENLFQSVLQLFLSAEGYQKVYEITYLSEGFLSDINASVWHPDYYSIDLFGDPENSGSWGFQLDGHHCAINFLVHGDEVSIVPAFLGGEPTVASYNGTSFDIFVDERDLALALYFGFSETEVQQAVSSGNGTMEVGPADRNGNVDPYRGSYDYSGFETGLKYTDMTTETQTKLLLIMQEYVYNLSTSWADVWWADVMDNIDDTYFVWVDDVDEPSTTTQFYYRIYNPYLWVEYNMEDVVGQGIEDWNHVHTITRIPNNPQTDNGGDYGIFAQIINQNDVQFLAQHYMHAKHHQDSPFLFDYQLKPQNDAGHHHHHRHVPHG